MNTEGKTELGQTRSRVHVCGLRSGHPFFDPVIRLQLIQLKQKGLYLEVLDMSLFLQILVSTVATKVNRIASQNGKGVKRTVLVCVSSCSVECTRIFLSDIVGTCVPQG